MLGATALVGGVGNRGDAGLVEGVDDPLVDTAFLAHPHLFLQRLNDRLRQLDPVREQAERITGSSWEDLSGSARSTVAGRLGHGGGGTTTLRTYTAWVSEADQRAAAGWTTRMPTRASLGDSGASIRDDPQHPYERIAAAFARGAAGGELQAGEPAPKSADLATEHEVSLATAARGVALAKEWGVLITDSAGRPRIAARPDVPHPVELSADEPLTRLRRRTGPWS